MLKATKKARRKSSIVSKVISKRKAPRSSKSSDWTAASSPMSLGHWRAATYVNFIFHAEPAVLEKLKAKFQLDEQVYRQNYLRLRAKKRAEKSRVTRAFPTRSAPMPNLNKVMLMGNLTRDPEIKYTPKGIAIADIALAVNRTYSTDSGEKREEVTFIDVTCWGRNAEIVGEYFKKGRPLYVEGRLQLDTWDDKTTGQKRSKLKVVGENIQFLSSREGGGGGGGGDSSEGGGFSQNRPARPASRPASPPPRPPADPDLDAAEDDIPF